MFTSYDTFKNVFKEMALPQAFVDLDAVDENARQILSVANGMPVRIASKSVRCRQLLRYLLDTYPGFNGLMTFTAKEAAWLYGQGFSDILMGYPTVESDELRAALEAFRHGSAKPGITFMVCSPVHIKLLNELAKEMHTQASVCIDIDQSLSLPGLHFGVRRSPLTTFTHVRPLMETLLQCEHVQFAGFMGYEAQIAGVPDNVPGEALKNQAIRFLKKLSTNTILKRRSDLCDQLQKIYGDRFPVRLFNGGGTGSLAFSRQDSSLTELTAGSGIFEPTLFDHYQDFQLQPAAGFALRINRIPAKGWIACHGGGYIASGSTHEMKQPAVILPKGLKLSPLEGAGEVQTPMQGAGDDVGIGDPVLMRHAKAGELCERFSQLTILRDGKVIDEWKTYRGEGQTFL